MKLEEFNTYNLSMELGEKVWAIVTKWDYFAKDTVGKQLVRAVDSIGSNLGEGFGRYHFRKAKNFSYYSRGSLFETKTWLTKAHNRKLINTSEFESLLLSIDSIGKMLNNYIKSIGTTKDISPMTND